MALDKIFLDTNKNAPFNPVKVTIREGDANEVLPVQLSKNFTEYNLTSATINFEANKPDGKVVLDKQSANFTGKTATGLFYYKLPPELFQASGAITTAYFTIGNRESTSNFQIAVLRKAGSALASDNYITDAETIVENLRSQVTGADELLTAGRTKINQISNEWTTQKNRINLEWVAQKSGIDTALKNANTAVSKANTAVSNANTAVTKANTSAENANKAKKEVEDFMASAPTNPLFKGEKGDKGDTGERGKQGIRGETGSPLKLMGSLDSTDGLPETAEPGEIYAIGRDVYFYDQMLKKWQNYGELKGPSDLSEIVSVGSPIWEEYSDSTENVALLNFVALKIGDACIVSFTLWAHLSVSKRLTIKDTRFIPRGSDIAVYPKTRVFSDNYDPLKSMLVSLTDDGDLGISPTDNAKGTYITANVVLIYKAKS